MFSIALELLSYVLLPSQNQGFVSKYRVPVAYLPPPLPNAVPDCTVVAAGQSEKPVSAGVKGLGGMYNYRHTEIIFSFNPQLSLPSTCGRFFLKDPLQSVLWFRSNLLPLTLNPAMLDSYSILPQLLPFTHISTPPCGMFACL